MKITIDKHHQRLLVRLLRWTLEKAKEETTFGIQTATHPFVIAELEGLLKRIDPTAVPPTVVSMKETA